MNYMANSVISASKAIEYMQIRLSAGQMVSAESRSKISKGMDPLIEHMRLRLMPAYKRQGCDEFHIKVQCGRGLTL